MAGHAKIRRILDNLPVFPKENCTSKKTYREFLGFLVQFSFGNTGRLFKIRRIFALYAAARHLLLRRFSEGVTIKLETVIPKSSHIEHKMSGQPAPGRTHGRNIRFCGVGYPCGVLLRGICGVFAGFEPRRDEPRKIPRIRNRAERWGRTPCPSK